MALIEDVKCPRCDRKYSGVRSRCPYCGARRIGFGRYSKDSDNAKGKMLISVLILSVLTVAAGIMLFSTDAEVGEEPSPEPEEIDGGIVSLPTIETPTPSPTPEETPTPPPPEVSMVAVKHTDGAALAFGNEFSMAGGTTLDLMAVIDPPGVEAEPIIESSNEDVFTVEWISTGVKNGFRVTAVGKGNANLVVSAGDITTTIIVRVT